ncbi:hypothetical protein [Aquipuribacter sp. SD81]|uniref:hypothetical protein n=1 Tax=Aquipuribacter sp. SD81 TaxID=3127703 RepID=UPI003015A4E5
MHVTVRPGAQQADGTAPERSRRRLAPPVDTVPAAVAGVVPVAAGGQVPGSAA